MTKLFVTKKGSLIIPHYVSVEDFNDLKDGEYVCEFTRPRNLPFHRKYFSLLNFSFKNWIVEDEKFKSFEQFRKDIAIMSGFYEQVYSLKHGIVTTAKSISFAKMDDLEFSELFLRTKDIIWRNVLQHFKQEELDDIVMELLRFD